MSDKRISALTEQAGLNTGDFLAIDNSGESESKKIDQAYFSGQYSDMQNVLGSKNLMPNEATTQVVSGITFTKYSDGSIKANGTASANINFVLSSSFTLPKGDYILTDGVKNQSYYVDIKNGSTVIARARDDGEFTLAADTTLSSEIWIPSGQVVSNVIFYPMVRPANIPNTEYVPYAKSNKELTEDVASLNASLNKYSDIGVYLSKSHTAASNIRSFDIPSDKKVIDAKLYDTAKPYIFEWYWDSTNSKLSYLLFTIYQGSLIIKGSSETVTVYYCLVDK